MRRFTNKVAGFRAAACCVFLMVVLAATQDVGVRAAPDDEAYTLLLKARQFIPPTGARAPASSERRHLIIQFEDRVDQEDVNALARIGVQVLSSVPRNAVLAYVPPGTDLRQVEGLRWSGALAPSDKISALIDMSLLDGYFLLDIHLDVDRATGEALVDAAGGIVYFHPDLPPTTLLVGGDINTVNILAVSDEVSYMYPSDEAIINGEPVFFCPGPITEFGVLSRFVVSDADGWDGPGLGSFAGFYNFTNATTDLPGSTEETIVANAINEWGVFADISFTATGVKDADDSIQVLWGFGDHTAISGFTLGLDPAFNGAPFGVLAHAFFPANSETSRGDIHFDEDEDWNDPVGTGFDLFTIALHEAGHSHGMGHSDDVNAVMFPSVQGIVTKLDTDDIAGIQTIYAAPSGIEVYHPNGGENFNSGETKTIVWNDGANAGANVSIALLKSGVFQGFISASTPNDGVFDWTIPSGLTTSANYTIRIQSLPTPAILDTSDSTFMISKLSTTIFSAMVPENIPDNTGADFAAFSNIVVPSGLGTVRDINISNIRIDYGDMSDLRIFLLNPVDLLDVFTVIMSPGHCSSTALSSSAPFGFDDEAAAAIGNTCPPASGVLYVPDFTLTFFDGIDPTGMWTLVVADTNLASGADGTLVDWDIEIGTADPDPGQFTPVHVDAGSTAPGSGTSDQPYTLLPPAITTVASSGEVRISGGTYNESPLMLTKPLTMTRKSASSGSVIIQ